MKEPVRLWQRRGELDELLARALDPNAVEPSALELDAMTSKLAASLGVPLASPGSPVSAGPVAGSSALAGATALVPAWKLAAWVMSGVVLGVGLSGTVTALVSPPDGPAPANSPEPHPMPSAATRAAPPPFPEPNLPAPTASVTSPPPTTSPARAPEPRGPERSSETLPLPSDGELSLLRRAQESLHSNPRSALAMTVRHEQEYPSGLLAQEREVIAIDALVRLGRFGEARARADLFQSRYPGSAHARRLEQLLKDAP